MLKAARISQAGAAKAQIAKPFTVPAPVGGLNARDGYTEMQPTDAVTLDNWFPEAQYCAVRGGTAQWKTGMGSSTAVRTLMVWYNSAGTDKILAAAGTSIYDVSTQGGSVGAAAVTGLTNVDFQWTTMTTSGGNYLIACNGADHVQNFDGTTWTNPTITGVTDTTLNNVFEFKQRLWFAQANTLNLYYLPTQSIAGAATQFPLGAVFRRGGSIAAMGSFSQDSGDGPDDYFAIVTTNGEIAVYQGIDPTTANAWQLVGLFDGGPPIGKRSMARLNGDLAVVTVDGVLSMRALLQFDRDSDQKAAFTAKIQTLFSQAAQSYSGNFGWQIMLYPNARYCIVNYPIVANSQQKQFVMNTVTGAWCTFSNLNAGCWARANNLLFFGGNNGTVYQANTGNTDLGANITADLKTAWSLFDYPEKKTVTLMKPIMLSGGGLSYALRLNWDFDDTPPSNFATPLPVTGGVWGSMVWPWVWGGNNIVTASWKAGGGTGTWGAVRLKTTVNGGAVQLNAFSLMVEPGGAL